MCNTLADVLHAPTWRWYSFGFFFGTSSNHVTHSLQDEQPGRVRRER
jgi:hypothetical protein